MPTPPNTQSGPSWTEKAIGLVLAAAVAVPAKVARAAIEAADERKPR